MYCEHCGQQIDSDSEYCCRCGKKVEPLVKLNTEKRQQDKQKKYRKTEPFIIYQVILNAFLVVVPFIKLCVIKGLINYDYTIGEFVGMIKDAGKVTVIFGINISNISDLFYIIIILLFFAGIIFYFGGIEMWYVKKKEEYFWKYTRNSVKCMISVLNSVLIMIIVMNTKVNSLIEIDFFNVNIIYYFFLLDAIIGLVLSGIMKRRIKDNKELEDNK